MYRISILILTTVALVANGSVSRADDKSHKAAAEELIKVVEAEKVMDLAIDVALEQQLKANPQLAPAKNAIRKFYSKYLSYAVLKDDFLKIYTDEFTEEELKKATEFYSTPTGKKMVAKMPVLFQKGAEIGRKRMQDHTDELRELIEEELKKQ